MKKLITIAFLLLSFSAWADGDLTFTWTAPTEREDTTPLPVSEIGGFKIYGNNQVIDVPIGTATTHTQNYIGRGMTEFMMTAYDTDGLESNMSLPVMINLSAPPKEPINFGGKKVRK